jgi:hypothetical protein
VFVTEGTYTGDLGGLAGADAICQAEADAAGLTGLFKAWISDSQTGPASRFVPSQYPYVLVNGSWVADDWTDLTDGFLESGISVTATGTYAAGYTWTNTLADGDPHNWMGDPQLDNCLDWTIGGDEAGGQTGIVGVTDPWWTFDIGSVACSRLYRLYCMQQ